MIGYEKDPIFLLSVEEFEKYKKIIPIYDQSWWLRTTGGGPSFAAFIDEKGKCDKGGDYKSRSCHAICPAIRLDHIKATVGKKIKLAGREWLVIDDGIAIALTPLAIMCYAIAGKDYENSEVRHYLLAWYMQNVIMKTTEVYISVSGGMVHNVYATAGHPVAVTIIDHDTDDPNEKEQADLMHTEVVRQTVAGELNYVY